MRHFISLHQKVRLPSIAVKSDMARSILPSSTPSKQMFYLVKNALTEYLNILHWGSSKVFQYDVNTLYRVKANESVT